MDKSPAKQTSQDNTLKIVLIVLGVIFILVIICCVVLAAFGAFTASQVSRQIDDVFDDFDSLETAVVEELPNLSPTAAGKGSLVSPFDCNQKAKTDGILWSIKTAKDHGAKIFATLDYLEDCVSTSGKYVSVDFTVNNTTKDPVNLSDINIVDNTGREFEEATDIFKCTLSTTVFFETINPGLEERFTAYFEVPKNAKGLMLKIGNLKPAQQEFKYIALGL